MSRAECYGFDPDEAAANLRNAPTRQSIASDADGTRLWLGKGLALPCVLAVENPLGEWQGIEMSPERARTVADWLTSWALEVSQ